MRDIWQRRYEILRKGVRERAILRYDEPKGVHYLQFPDGRREDLTEHDMQQIRLQALFCLRSNVDPQWVYHWYPKAREIVEQYEAEHGIAETGNRGNENPL